MKITKQQEDHARAVYRGDWDEDGTVNVYMPTSYAIRLLAVLGWGSAPNGQWLSPNGEQYWEADEALQIALTAIAS